MTGLTNRNRDSFVSVIIPAYNDPEDLSHCLTALWNQNYPKDLYEVIVVDNNSDPPLESVVKGFPFDVKILVETRQGSYAARNKGIRLAKGPVLAFTDADCLPETDWIEKGAKEVLSANNIGLVGGRIDVFPHNPENPTVYELVDMIFGFDQESYIKKGNYAATANMFTRKEVFDEVGLFDEELISGGDKEWGNRVRAHGLDLHYSSQAMIRHPARCDFPAHHKKLRRIAHGLAQKGELKIEAMEILVPPLVAWAKIFKTDRTRDVLDKVRVGLAMWRIKNARLMIKIRHFSKSKRCRSDDLDQ